MNTNTQTTPVGGQEPVAPAPTHKSILVTKTNLRLAAKTFESCAATNTAMYFPGGVLAVSVERALGKSTPGAASLNKSFFVQSSYEPVLAVLMASPVIDILSRGAAEYVLRHLPIDTVAQPDVSAKPQARAATTHAPAASHPLLQEVCTGLQERHGIKLSLQVGRGTLTLPSISNDDWSFQCPGSNIQFPVKTVCEGSALMQVTLGHYVISSRKNSGFDAATLQSAVEHCFNLLG